MNSNTIAPESIVKRKIYRRLLFYGLAIIFTSVMCFNSITMGFYNGFFSNVFYVLISCFIIISIFAVIVIKNVKVLVNFDKKIVSRKVECPICHREYIADKKAIEEMNEVVQSHPDLDIDPKIIACCDCFNKLTKEDI